MSAVSPLLYPTWITQKKISPFPCECCASQIWLVLKPMFNSCMFWLILKIKISPLSKKKKKKTCDRSEMWNGWSEPIEYFLFFVDIPLCTCIPFFFYNHVHEHACMYNIDSPVNTRMLIHVPQIPYFTWVLNSVIQQFCIKLREYRIANTELFS